jgi:hypothetical protein
MERLSESSEGLVSVVREIRQFLLVVSYFEPFKKGAARIRKISVWSMPRFAWWYGNITVAGMPGDRF